MTVHVPVLMANKMAMAMTPITFLTGLPIIAQASGRLEAGRAPHSVKPLRPHSCSTRSDRPSPQLPAIIPRREISEAHKKIGTMDQIKKQSVVPMAGTALW